jgi:cyclomaltodextrinase / maltogenic alpha-amylase / neopullulanase
MKTVLSSFTKAVWLILFLFSLSSFNTKAIDSENQMDSISIKKTAPQWTKNANIYEVNTRQYTPQGTFKAFQQHLPRLKAMGVNILWLMPINPIGEKNRKGTLGSYYSVKDYTAVNPEYGTEADFKNLVSEAHKLGMHVIIDWVANHTSWDNVWIKPHSDWYTKDSLGNITIPKGTDWMDTADLNYDNPELRRAMIDAMKYWVKNADIDGFRCDVAGMVPITFWIHARKEIDALKPGCFFLAEDAEPKIYAAFDMTYDWPLKDLINDVAKGKANVSDLIAFFETESKRLNPENIRMQFITNHDENTWNGTEYERLGDAPVDPFTVLTYTIPGMPLTYSGQEEPLKRRLRFFDKDTINFRTFERKELITKLNQLKFKNTALLSNSYKSGFVCLKNSSPNVILSFVRQNKNSQVLCVFNFSDKEQRFKIQDELQVGFSKYIGENITVKNGFENKLKPWSYAIYLK